jgi:hypothetical protein
MSSLSGVAQVGVDVAGAFFDGKLLLRGTFSFHNNSGYAHIGITARKGARRREILRPRTGLRMTGVLVGGRAT